MIAQSGAVANAAGYVERLLQGSLATSIAVLAVAGLGFAMLQGRLSAREGGRILVGCFILFGAPVMAQGLLDLVRYGSGAPAWRDPVPISAPPVMAMPPPPDPDPYSAAAVPMQ